MTDIRRRRWYHRRGLAPVVGAALSWFPTAAPTEAPAGAAVPAPPLDTPAVLRRLHDYLRVQVRSGVYELAALRQFSLDAASSETPDPRVADELAREVLSAEFHAWVADAARWSARTDCDRLDAALAQVRSTGALVLPGLVDDQALAVSLRIHGAESGCVAYFVTDIWRAIDTTSLHLTVLDGAGVAAPRTHPVLSAVVDAIGEQGLLASTLRTGGVDVAMTWRRRPRS
ncbi:MAG: hypothetical protein ABJA87_01855 [bacterium]